MKTMKVKIEVDGTDWRQVKSLAEVGPKDRVFFLDTNTAQIIFGDGRRGRRPPAGSEITIPYRVGGGAAGNVSGANLKVSFNWEPLCKCARSYPCNATKPP